MARKRKKKPFDPAAAERNRQEREANLAEVTRLEAMPDVAVSVDPQTRRLTGAYRVDVVEAMLRSGKIGPNEESAVRSLEALIYKAVGNSGSSLGVLDRVSGGVTTDPVAACITASRQLAKRAERMDPTTWGLLRELCDGNLISTRWRQVVARRTGETQPEAQSGVIRQAFRVLAEVEEALRKRPNTGPEKSAA